MRRRLEAISGELRREAEARIHDALRDLVARERPRLVAAYAALPSEPRLEDWLAELRRAGVELALPRVGEASPELRLLRAEDDLVPGPFGLRQPSVAAPPVRIEEACLVLVPGLAFDSCGGRLGRGGGFYDRLLAPTSRGPASSRPRVWGVCFAIQIVPAVPCEAHDAPVAGCVSERGAHAFA